MEKCLIPGLVLKQASQMATSPQDEPLPTLRTDINDNNHPTGLRPAHGSPSSGLRGLGPTRPDKLGHAPTDGHAPGSSHSGSCRARSGSGDDACAPVNPADRSAGKAQSHFRPWLASSSKSTDLRKSSSHPYVRITKSP